jgi:uncharacterized protein (DUF362 family)
MKTKVYVIKRKQEESNQDVVLRTLRMVPLEKIIKNTEDKILINPNWVNSDHSNTGNVTSTDTLEGIVLYLIEDIKIDPNKLIVADGGSFGTDQGMKVNNAYRLEEYGIKVFNLNDDQIIRNVKIPNPYVLKKVDMVKTALDVSCIISVPSLKTHSLAKTTLSMKNMMGLIYPKGIMHSKIHRKIPDLVSIVREKMKFQVIDGIIGSNGSELGGKPIQMDLIIAGEDPVAVDRVGSSIMGRTLSSVKYLEYAQEKGLGNAKLDEIEIIGETFESVFHQF